MNFYKHHIGDYAQATAHLSFAEDAAYSRLLRKYYAEEQPIAGPLRAAQRLVGARTREEREAVETVLEEFFDWDEPGNCWRNKRADEEIERYQAQAENNRRIAEAREARKRARKADEDSTNRGNSGDDSSNDSCAPTEHESLPVREPSQKPLARSQKKSITPDTTARTGGSEGSSQDAGEPRAPLSPTLPGVVCKAMRAAGVFHVNPADPRLIAALEAGVTLTELEATAQEAASHTPPKGFAWAIATALGRRHDAAQGGPHATSTPGRRPSLAERAQQHERDANEREHGPTDGDVIDGTARRVG